MLDLCTLKCRIVALSSLAAVFMLSSGSAMADIKKWVEPNGRVNYGEHPPEGAVIVPFSAHPDRTGSDRTEPDRVESVVSQPPGAKRPKPGWSWRYRGSKY
jgi:hypothetical protein